jgi:CRP-like cAMP-binding protein
MLLRRRSDKVDVLKRVPLFSGLSRRHLDLIARHADQVNLDAGRVLARQGGLGREFILIVDGSARVERDGRRIARLGPGDFFGEMSLIDGRPRSATVTAETPMVLLVVHTRSFSYLLDTVPALRKKILVTLCERLRAADAALGARN